MVEAEGILLEIKISAMDDFFRIYLDLSWKKISLLQDQNFITVNEAEIPVGPKQRQKSCLHYHCTELLHFTRFQTTNVLGKIGMSGI